GSDTAVDALEGHGGVVRRRELELELENLLAAARRAIPRGDGRTAAETFNAAYPVLLRRGPMVSAIDLGRAVLNLQLSPHQQARVLTSLGEAERICGLMSEARSH